MTGIQLIDALTVDATGRATLSLDQLPAGLAGALGPFLAPARQLVFEQVTDHTAAADHVTVAGVVTTPPFTGMTVTAALTVVDGAVTAAIQAVGDDTWSIGASFSRLDPCALDLLRFTAPTLSFQWPGAVDASAASLAFTGTMLTLTGVALLDLTLPAPGSTVHGQITVVPSPTGGDTDTDTRSWPQVTLAGPAASISLGPLTVGDLSVGATADRQAAAGSNLTVYEPPLRVAGSVSFATGGRAHDVAIFTELSGPADAALFGADFSAVGDLPLADVAALMRQALSIPFGFDVPGNVRLGEVRLVLTPTADTAVRELSATVSTRAQWPITDRLTVENIDVTFRCQPGPQGFSVGLRGFLAVGTAATLEVAADSATRSLGARLREGDPPPAVRAVHQALTGQDGSHLPDLRIDRLECSVTLPADNTPMTVHGLVQLAGTWQITDTLEVGDALFMITHSTAGTTFRAGGRLAIDDISVRVNAGYNPADGWQFSGETGPGQQIPIGTFIASLSRKFGRVELPAPLAGLTVSNLRAAFGTKSTDIAFAAEADIPLSPNESAQILVSVTFRKGAKGYEGSVAGQLTIGELAFDLRFSANAAETRFVATYRATGTARTIAVQQLVAGVSDEVAALVPAGLVITLNDAILAVNRTAAGTTVLLGFDLGARLNLSELPLVGQLRPTGQQAGIEDLRLVVAGASLDRAGVAAVNAMLPDGIAKLPLPPATADPGAPDIAVPQGLSVSARLDLGGTPQTLALPVAGSGPPSADPGRPATPDTPVAVTSSDTAKWYTLQKSLGPLYLSRIGVRYQDAVLWILLDAALSALGLTVSLDGLALGSPLSRFDPRFDLRGLGIDYRNPAVEIGGTFLRTTVTDSRGGTYDEYDGAAVLRAKALTLSAIGSYAYIDGHPSLFIYAVLDYPIGGPSFFFVTGLAAGFGYNRALIVPPVEGVAQFPLVAEATKGATPVAAAADPAARVAAELAALRSAVPPSTGQNFLAVGIRFTSFQMLDSFALLTVAFGQRFEVNLLGLSTLLIPPRVPGDSPAPPLVEIQLALKAAFVPDDGFLGVAAQLTPASYLLSRDCHLTGGFAFSCWFPAVNAPASRAGDFVLTLGGYHPGFDPPGHYPRVPRLGLNWKVSEQLAVKGDAYFALTPSMLMCGFVLDATWTGGDLRAALRAGADFLVAWKPYHYEAHAYASLQVTYRLDFFGTREIRLDASADLRLWGPPFTGRARVSLSVVEFDIAFGDTAPQAPVPLDWAAFKASFLPVSSCTVVLRDGLVRKTSDTPADLGVVNPKRFLLVTDSVIPSTAAQAGSRVDVSGLALSPVGVAPMAIPLGAFAASQTLRIRRDGQPAEQYFSFTPVVKRLPAALWGAHLTPALGDADFVEQALSGFEIRPAAAADPDTGATVGRNKWQYDDAPVSPTFGWQAGPGEPIGGERATAAVVRDTIAAATTVTARARLLNALGVTATIDVDPSAADAFVTAEGGRS
jgi:hypothetical protein